MQLLFFAFVYADKLEFNYMATKRGNTQDKAFPTRASSFTEL